jgi:hypothetical protein
MSGGCRSVVEAEAAAVWAFKTGWGLEAGGWGKRLIRMA